MGHAAISPCGRYRYSLTRQVAYGGQRLCLFVMLNPSTADADRDDPTIRRCMNFAKREGCHTLTVVNLFALRATNPDELLRVVDPVGPDNDPYLSMAVEDHRHSRHLIIAAWGANALAARMRWQIKALLQDAGALCLGMTAEGHPRHPLYIANHQPLVRWTGKCAP